MKLTYLCLILALLIAPYSLAAIIRVPSDQATIQAGINAARNGDTVLVADGTYTGEGNRNLDFGGRAITVSSENGAENCVNDCEEHGRGFYFHSGESRASVVKGFTITNGHSPSADDTHGGGIYCMNSSPTIADNIITGNSSIRPITMHKLRTAWVNGEKPA